MEISLNYGCTRYFINENWLCVLSVVITVAVCLRRRQKRKMKKKLEDLAMRGGDNSKVLQKLYDKCLSEDTYVQVKDNKVKEIIRKMLNSPANQPLLISAPVYFLALLKNNAMRSLVLQKGGNKLIVENTPRVLGKVLSSVLFTSSVMSMASATLLIALTATPFLAIAMFYAHLNINCHFFVDSLPKIEGNLQYVEQIADKNAPIIISSYKNKLLYQEFDETKLSSSQNLQCFMRKNCLGTESIQIKENSKNKVYIPLKERTKTLSDLKSPIDEMHEIDIKKVKYKQEEIIE